MDSNLGYDYNQFSKYVASCNNITREYLSHLWISVYESDKQNLYSKPMPWIGMYIALASLVCVLAMLADLLHGLHNRKLWLPCKYFTLNAASLTVIAVAIKLPMDLTNLMPGFWDQATKLGSLGFMCTMMANLLPSLATMDSKELLTNMIALVVLVITLVVNVCIQINTRVLSYSEEEALLLETFGDDRFLTVEYISGGNEFIAAFYVGMLLMMLVLYACSSLAILNSKQILESKYQEAHQTALHDHDLQQPRRLSTVEKLKQHVINYWIMAGTGSPQFMTICSATTSASGVISALCILLHIYMRPYNMQWELNSDYKWSMFPIYIIQFIGVILGSFSPLSRCFAALSFKPSVKWIWNYIKVYKVESYWTEKLYDWKQSSIPFRSRRWRIVIQNLKILFLSIGIGFQKTVVVACKTIRVIPVLFVIFVLYCSHCWKWLKAMFSATLGIVLVQNPEQLGNNSDLSRYVLQIQDDMEFAETTLKGMSKSVNRLIQKAEKQQPNNLMKLLAESKGFEGVLKFDSHHVPSLLSEEYLSCWSLPLVTLTTIATSLPDIRNNKFDCLLRSASEGLVYVRLVEENLNAIDDHVSIQNVAETLWLEVEVYHEWLGNKLQKFVPKANTATQILQWWRDTAKNMVTEVESMDIGILNDNSKYRSISANSMYRITETLILSYNAYIDQVSQEELFVQISSMMADILAACLTNLPRVIAMKCHVSTIEKREASVRAAAKLLGETTQIISSLEDRELPSLNPEELAFIDMWRAYLMHPFP